MFSIEKCVLFYNLGTIAFLEIYCQSGPLSWLVPGFLVGASNTTLARTHHVSQLDWMSPALGIWRSADPFAIMEPEAELRRCLRWPLSQDMWGENKQSTTKAKSFPYGQSKVGSIVGQEDDPGPGGKKKIKALLLFIGQGLSKTVYQQNGSFSLIFQGVGIDIS